MARITAKNIMNKKYHLHLLTLPICILFIYFGDRGFLHLDTVGKFFLPFLSVFLAAILGFLVEWYQGVKGYNRTRAEVKESRKDIAVSILGGALAIFAWDNLYIALISFIIIVGIEIYRRKNLHN